MSLDLLDYPSGEPPALPPGYPAPIIAHFANALMRRGHQLVVFTLSRDIDAPVVIDQGNLVVCVAPRCRPRSVLTFYSPERECLASLMKSHPCDLVHAMWSYEFALAGLQSGAPTLVHYRDHAGTILRHSPDRLFRWLLNAYVSRGAEFRATNSAYLKRQLGRRARDAEIIPNFLPAGTLIPEHHEPAARNGGAGIVLTVSNGFRGRKNVAAALQAFALVRRSAPTLSYHLIGAGLGLGGEARDYARRNHLDQGVLFLGPQPFDKTLEEIAGASVLLHPSLEESFGMTVLEAMAAGTPVVAGRTAGNIPELLDSGRCGRLCDVRDPADMARAVAAAFGHKPETAAMVSNAWQRYRAHYSEQVVMDQLERSYARILSRRADGPDRSLP